MNSSDVTTVIPAWDVADELAECLRSYETQNLCPALIIVDNASREALPISSGAEHVRLERRVTVGAARNEGLARVKTPYVQFMDADDVLEPGGLDVLWELALRHPRYVAVSGASVAWDPESGRTAPARWPFSYAYRLHKWPLPFALVNSARDLFPITGPVLLKTDAAKRAGGFADGNWAEDWALGAALCFEGRVAMTKTVCTRFRTSENRYSLSDEKEGHFAPSWSGRRRVRERLRTSRVVPRLVRSLVGILVPIHLLYTLRDLRLKRQRV